MRVTKNTDGSFVIDDAPLRVEGEAAKSVLDAMKDRDVQGNDAGRKHFLDECSAIYRRSK